MSGLTANQKENRSVTVITLLCATNRGPEKVVEMVGKNREHTLAVAMPNTHINAVRLICIYSLFPFSRK